MDKEISPERIRYLLDYDPDTGILTRKVSVKGGRKAGAIVGVGTSGGYRTVMLDGRLYKCHRIAYAHYHNKFPDGDIDHIKGDGTDNRIVNLRCVSHKQNTRNQRKQKNVKAKFCGVYWIEKRNSWEASIRVDGKNRHLGRFKCFIEAIATRIRANKQYGFHENHGRV